VHTISSGLDPGFIHSFQSSEFPESGLVTRSLEKPSSLFYQNRTCTSPASIMGRFTLYSWPESGNSYKVRLLCALLKIDYDIKDLDFLNLEQQGPEFKAINPKSEVPALVEGDLTLTDSSSILTYIAATNPNPGQTKTPSSYWSSNLIEQVSIIEWLAFANGWVQHGVFTARAILSYGGPYNGLGQNTNDAALNRIRLEESKVRGHKSLEIIDGELAKRQWLVGGRPTIADISNFVYISLVRL
jgi:glutathione S-transferase